MALSSQSADYDCLPAEIAEWNVGDLLGVPTWLVLILSRHPTFIGSYSRLEIAAYRCLAGSSHSTTLMFQVTHVDMTMDP